MSCDTSGLTYDEWAVSAECFMEDLTHALTLNDGLEDGDPS